MILALLLVKLGVGPLRLDLSGGQRQLFLIDGGVAQMKDNRLTILSTSAMAARPKSMITTSPRFRPDASAGLFAMTSAINASCNGPRWRMRNTTTERSMRPHGRQVRCAARETGELELHGAGHLLGPGQEERVAALGEMLSDD